MISWGRVICTIALLVVDLPNTRAREADFNKYIVGAVEKLSSSRSHLGYDPAGDFTQDLSYGPNLIKARKPPKAACAAAVIEVMVGAMNLYAKDHGNEVFSRLPVDAFVRSNLTGLKANIYMFAQTGSRGTGHTLTRFNLGSEVAFAGLKPGDFINFTRKNYTGRAAVFIGYLNQNQDLTSTYSPDVIGFRYFAAIPAKQSGGGLSYMNAFFDGHCPAPTGKLRRDCAVIRSNNPLLLSGGRMHEPSLWDYFGAIESLKAEMKGIIRKADQAADNKSAEDAVDEILKTEIPQVQETPGFFDDPITD